MNRFIICLVIGLVASTGLAQNKPALKDQKDKASYSIGFDIGSTFKKQGMEVNPDVLLSGLKDALSGKEAMTKEEREMQEKQAAATKAAAEKNAADGEKFLAENKKKDGVKTTESGLQYKVITEGSGASPKATDTVVVNYKGSLLDGTEFDSSYKRKEPATFPVNRVIAGWTEALQLMKPGAKYELVIPAKLGYGERGAGRDIGPNSTLIFEVELLSIKAPEATPTPGGSPSANAKPAPASSAAALKPSTAPVPAPTAKK